MTTHELSCRDVLSPTVRRASLPVEQAAPKTWQDLPEDLICRDIAARLDWRDFSRLTEVDRAARRLTQPLWSHHWQALYRHIRQDARLRAQYPHLPPEVLPPAAAKNACLACLAAQTYHAKLLHVFEVEAYNGWVPSVISMVLAGQDIAMVTSHGPIPRYTLSSEAPWRVQQREAFTAGWAEKVLHVDLSRSLYITGNTDKFIASLWELALQTRRYAFFGHAGRIMCAALAENTLVTGSEDRTARLWDIQTGASLHVLRHDAEVNQVAIQGQRLATNSRSGDVHFWDVRTGALQRVWAMSPNWLRSMALTDDTFIYSLRNHTAYLRDLRTGKVRPFQAPTGHVERVAATAAGNTVVTAAPNGALKLWHKYTGQQLTHVENRVRLPYGKRRRGDLCGLTLSGNTIMTAFSYGSVELWDFQPTLTRLSYQP